MAPSRKTWIWILVAVVGLCVVGMIAIAGFGLYFVSHHVQTRHVSSADAFKAFDEARAMFKNEQPVFDMDKMDEPRQVRQLSSMPTSTKTADLVWVLAWNPERERLVRVSMPFWVLRLGKQKIDISSGGFNFDRLQLDVNELQRVGPVLLFDVRTPSGERVLIWTQ
jgi:hypothetical protein